MQHIPQKYVEGSPFSQGVDVMPMQTLWERGGVQAYRCLEGNIRTTTGTSVVVGLVEGCKGVHMTAENALQPVDAQHPPCSLEHLFRHYTALKRGPGSEIAVKQFCDRFREIHVEYLGAAVSQVGYVSYYTSSRPAGTYKWPQEDKNTRHTSTVIQADNRGDEKEVQVENIEWARAIDALVPQCLLPTYRENLCRVYGDSATGITAPMAYFGACIHFFDVHFEETGMAAVNCRVLFQKSSGEKTKHWRLSPLQRVANYQTECLVEHQRFFEDIERGIACIKSLSADDSMFQKSPVPKKQANRELVCLPNEFIDLFNDIGYKEWFMFHGDTAETEQLAAYVNSKLDPNDRVPGIRVLQHFLSTVDKIHITLDPAKFTGDVGCSLKTLWQRLMQTAGDCVYTDTRLHVGRGWCSFNTAWNMLPLGVFSRSLQAELGSCCPFVFNMTAANLARDAPLSTLTGGAWDSHSSKL
jgi:hypothetical protein